MCVRHQLKPLQPSDYRVVREIYADAIQFQGQSFYTKEQIEAWSALAWLPGVLDRPLSEGLGWLSLQNQTVVAFAVRYPLDRLALLYCRSGFHRKGHASSLLDLYVSICIIFIYIYIYSAGPKDFAETC